MALDQLKTGSQETRDVVNAIAEAVDTVQAANVGGSVAGKSLVGKADAGTGPASAITASVTGTVPVYDGTSIAFGAVPAAGLATGAVTTAKLAANAVTGPGLSATAMHFVAFTGHNNTGACAATGVKVGDTVVGVVSITDGTSAASSFESTITVADQIQQTSASDLSTKKFSLLVVAKS